MSRIKAFPSKSLACLSLNTQIRVMRYFYWYPNILFCTSTPFIHTMYPVNKKQDSHSGGNVQLNCICNPFSLYLFWIVNPTNYIYSMF